VYGYGLRTLMSIGAAQRRHTLVSIVRGYLNPHDPIDVVRWALTRRLPSSTRSKTEALDMLDRLALASRSTRAMVAKLGIDNVRADHVAERILGCEPDEQQPDEQQPGSSWAGVASAITQLEQLVEPDRAQLAALLASGELGIARAWAQENLLASER